MMFFDSFRWRYVGVVEGISKYKEEHIETRGYWVLEQTPSSRRRAKLVGDPGSSPYANRQRAAVEAWVRGGPIPELLPSFSSAPTGPKAKLLSFPGGKEP